MPPSPLSAVVRHIRALAERAHGATLPDHLLLERFIHQHDEAAFALLVRRHGGLVLGVARRILHDVHAAEDVFQNTFLTLARRAASIRKREALPSWLYGVAARLASQIRLQEGRRRKREHAVAKPSCEDVAEATAWRELGAVLDEELQRLPEKCRAPLVLIYFSGLTQEAAARQLEWSLGTLRRRLERGKRLLHDRLLRRGVSLSIGLLTTAIAQSAVEAALPALLVERTVQQAVQTATVQATGWLVGTGLLTRAKVTLMLSLLLGTGTGFVLFPMAPRPPAEEKPQENALPPPPAATVLHFDRFGDPLPPRAMARLGTIRFHQGGDVNGLAFSRDGRLLASAGGWSDRTVHLWDVATAKEVRLFTGPTGNVRAVAFSPDGKTLAAGSDDGSLHLWDAKTGRLQRVFTYKFRIESVAFAPDGKHIACACNSPHGPYLLRRIDITTGRIKTNLQAHQAPIHSVVFSPDGKTLATASLDKSIRLWDPRKGESRLQINGHFGEVYSLIFSPDGKRLASASQDQTVRSWDTATGKELLQLKGHTAAVRAVAFSPDGKTLASGSDDWTIRLWDAADGKPRGEPHRHLAPIISLAFRPDGKLLASGSNAKESTIRLWDLTTGAERLAREGHNGWAAALRLSPDGRTLFSAGTDQRMFHWDLATGKVLDQFEAGQFRGKAVDFSPDGKTVATGCSDKCVYLWDLAGGRQLRRFQGHKATVNTVAFTRDGKTLLSTSWDNTMRLWDVASGRELRRLAEPLTQGVKALALSADGKTVVIGRSDGTVHVRDLADGQPLRTLPPATGPVESLLFSPDGKFLAVSGEVGGTLYVYDWAGKKVIHQLTRGPRAIYDVAFSPDGRSLAALGGDRIVRIWEMASGRLRAQFEGHRGAGASVLFAPDGRTLYTGSSDSTILVWDLTGRQEQRRLRPAELTPTDVEALGNDLAGEDAAKAYQAIWTLAAFPRQAVPFLQKHLRPAAPIAGKRVAQLVKELDDDAFSVREKASKELAHLVDTAEPALRKALEENPSPEVRRRLRQLLEQRQHSGPEIWRQTRLLEVLEQIETPEARQMLEELANGSPGASLTQEAKAALERCKRTRSH